MTYMEYKTNKITSNDYNTISDHLERHKLNYHQNIILYDITIVLIVIVPKCY